METLAIPVVWSTIAGACLATGVIHLGASLRPRQVAGLAFSAAAFSVMCVAAFELLLMRSQGPAEYGATLRWMHVPLFTAMVAIVIFVRAHFGAGRAWLGLAVCGVRFAALVLNFAVDPNIEYRAITSLVHVELLGEAVAVPVGDAGPWSWVGEASAFLLFAFVADAAATAWRRGPGPGRRRAVLVGGSLGVALAIAGVNTFLMHAGAIHSIYLYALPFSLVILAIASEASAGVAGSARLAGQLDAAKSELLASERRLDQAVGAAGIGSWEWDVRRDVVWMTPQGRALFGIGPDEAVDLERLLQALHPEDRAVARENVRHTLESGRFEREYRVTMPVGRTRWVHTRGGVDRDGEGRPVRLRGVSWDVTDRRQAEERFRLVVEAAGNGLVMLDGEGRVTLVNARAETIFGYTREEFRGLDIATLIPGGAWRAHPEAWDDDAAAPAGAAAGREVAGRRKDGSEVALEIGLARIGGPDGQGVLVSALDIGERKRRDDLLKEERAFLRQVIDIAPNLIFAKDRDGRFTLANQAVADLYGTSVEALIGRTDSDFNPNAAEVEAFRRDDWEVMDAQREMFVAEEHITDAAGIDRCLQTVKRPIIGPDGTAQQVLGVSTDVSARRNAELEVARQRDELAHLSRVTMVSELSGAMAHELNQPLAAILANAQAAQRFMRGDAPDLVELRAILDDIVADDRRASQVLEGLGRLLRKGEPRREPVDVNEVVRDTLRLLRSDLLNAQVDVQVALAAGLPSRWADRVQLQQVLLNLVLNACDAVAGNGDGPRALRVSSTLDEDGSVRVCVRDNGVGVSDQVAERLFEPFFTTKPEGLGLGLPICRNIISGLGGRLWARSNPDGGMTFCFLLPERREA